MKSKFKTIFLLIGACFFLVVAILNIPQTSTLFKSNPQENSSQKISPIAAEDNNKDRRKQLPQSEYSGLAQLVIGAGIPLRNQPFMVLSVDHENSEPLYVGQTDNTGKAEFALPTLLQSVIFQGNFLDSKPQVTAKATNIAKNSVDFGIVSFGENSSGVVIELSCADIFSQQESRCGVSLRTSTGGYVSQGPFGIFKNKSISSTNKTNQIILEVPSDAFYSVYFSNKGYLESTEIQPPLANRWDLHKFDLCGLCALQIELQGLPQDYSQAVVQTQHLSLDHSPSKNQQKEFYLEAPKKHLEIFDRLDETSTLLAFLHLEIGPPVALKTAENQFFLNCQTSALIPAEPLIGITLVTADRQIVKDTAFLIKDPRTEQTLNTAYGIALARETILQSATPLEIMIDGFGTFKIQAKDLEPLSSKLFGIPLPRKENLSEIRFAAQQENFLESDLKILLRNCDGDILQEKNFIAENNQLLWSFENLLPGCYKAFWSWGNKPILEDPVQITSREEKLIPIEPLRLKNYQGQFLAWEKIPTAYHPTRIAIEGSRVEIDDKGKFSIRLTSTIPEYAALSFPKRLEPIQNAARIKLSTDKDRLLAELLTNDVNYLQVDLSPCTQESFALEYWATTEQNPYRFESPWEASHALVRNDTMAQLPMGKNETISGCVWEWQEGRGRQRLLGFFLGSYHSNPTHIPCTGRKLKLNSTRSDVIWFDVNAKWMPSQNITLLVPLGRYQVDGEQAPWVPTNTSALVLHNPYGQSYEIELTGSEDSVSW